MNDTDPIERALAVIAERVSGSGASWLVGGSAGLRLRGLALEKPPRDLDLYADKPDAALLHEALRIYAVDEPVESVSAIYRSVLSHYRIEGVNVELVGGFVVASGADRYAVEVRSVLHPLRIVVHAGRYPVGLVPLAHEMWFNLLRGRSDRTRLIARAIRSEPEKHLPAFREIETRNALSAESVRRIRLHLSDPEREEAE
ncbi:hypothetical protein [Paenibacillus humicola]|uniref:hypothetical protein n=1 Tax=Paenibacillus humicola TaxID=3110540 RepID=UPI00237BCD61|nr:hypothetical protein [Paenibacillus humicola]